MRNINKVFIIGNLTRDPELKTTQGGQAITSFGVATNREWMTKDGQKHTSTEFHEVVAWARLAEICVQILKKGKLVYIEGYLKTRTILLPDNTKKYRTEVVIHDVIILEKREKDGEEHNVLIQTEESQGESGLDEFLEESANGEL
ncbi:MAG: single-strand DNA-binding protein, single-strand DNA-binding protein [Candidatus Peregrinibacteria bacterium GW2011_GWC2_39_14]|nr:MAG: single-strand binding protein [Candidatus Peregrinibacteria bacterium GW2011_GWA2_38_36]KKR04675.1 MAG: single-strand DNA-binding protein, single-strand DNA-binding protein [Candidatus Peregrinibacteria bacterium GW2011_GWC2_39_14]